MDDTKRRLTYANVTSTLALLVAVTGGVAVAADQIDGKNIKKGTITGKQVKNGSLKGKDLDQSTLSAVNAASVDGRSAVCGTGTVLFAGGCWELNLTPNATWFEAGQGCAARGGDLPSVGPLIRFAASRGMTMFGEWVNDLSYDGAVPAIRTFKISGTSTIENAALAEIHGYRCVIPLVR
jgi:hypothetical protein